MSKSEHRVSVGNGKYTFVTHPEGNAWKVVVEGQTWVFQIDGRDAIASMMAELDAARVVLATANELVRLGTAPSEIFEALHKHDRLVGEGGLPSSWCSEGEPIADPDRRPF